MIAFFAEQCPNSGYAFILEHGRVFTERRRTLPQYRRLYGEKKACYRNAVLLAMAEPHLTYVEGTAINSLGIPIEHGWTVTKSGIVIDPTWDDGPGEYFGVPFSCEWIYDQIVNKRVEYVPPFLDDWRNGWPLMNGKHGGPEIWRANDF